MASVFMGRNRGRSGARFEPILCPVLKSPRLLPRLSVCAGLAGTLGSLACSGTLNLGTNDAGVAYDADCRPGTYAGTYSCTSEQGTTLALALEGTLMSGPLAVTLVPAGATSLALTPDASLSAMNSGATFSSALSGVLDCPTRQLTGAVRQVVITSSSFNGTVGGTGELSAQYDTEGGAPALINGVLDAPSTIGATCTWSAQLQ
jgi:hypothetical protein